MLTGPPTIRTGHVLALRLFDAADRIDLEQAEALWRRYAAGAARRHGLAATSPKAVSFGVPPSPSPCHPTPFRSPAAPSKPP